MAITETGPSGPTTDPSYALTEIELAAMYGGAPAVEAGANPATAGVEGAVTAPLTPGTETVTPSITVTPTEVTPVLSDSEYGPAVPKERATVRIANRIARLADKFSGNMAGRRTTKDVLGSAVESAKDRKDKGLTLARTTGKSALLAASMAGTGLKETGKQAAGSVKESLQKQAAAATARKLARQTGRKDRRDERASDKAEFKDTQARAKAARKDRREQRSSDRAEFIQAQKQAARRIGRTAVETGVGLALLPVVGVIEGGRKVTTTVKEVRTTHHVRSSNRTMVKATNLMHNAALHQAKAEGVKIVRK